MGSEPPVLAQQKLRWWGIYLLWIKTKTSQNDFVSSLCVCVCSSSLKYLNYSLNKEFGCLKLLWGVFHWSVAILNVRNQHKRGAVSLLCRIFCLKFIMSTIWPWEVSRMRSDCQNTLHTYDNQRFVWPQGGAKADWNAKSSSQDL